MACWLMKSEPEEFSFDDLEQRPKQTEPWDGVRNYQARNFMRDDMSIGDQVLFYHSNCKVPGVVGIAEIASEAYPDPTAFDPEDKHYDPKSDPDKPRWMLVDVRFKRHLERVVSLQEIKQQAEAFEGLPLVRKGNRLSVMPVEQKHFDMIVDMAKQEPNE
jgi:predicted RNA-binding protein with PUA-like domain